jgi:hypothetical protein
MNKYTFYDIKFGFLKIGYTDKIIIRLKFVNIGGSVNGWH